MWWSDGRYVGNRNDNGPHKVIMRNFFFFLRNLFNLIWIWLEIVDGVPGGSVLKIYLTAQERLERRASIPGSGRSPGEGNGNPLQYSCLENPMDRRAWRATVPGVAESYTAQHTLFMTLLFCSWESSYFGLNVKWICSSLWGHALPVWGSWLVFVGIFDYKRSRIL